MTEIEGKINPKSSKKRQIRKLFIPNRNFVLQACFNFGINTIIGWAWLFLNYYMNIIMRSLLCHKILYNVGIKTII